MPITMIPLAVNIASGLLLWQTGLPVITKIILSMLIIVKYALFICYLLASDKNSFTKYVSLGICVIVNIALIVYTFVINEWMLAINIAATLILLIIWCSSIFLKPKQK